MIQAVFNEPDINGNTNRGSEVKLILGSGYGFVGCTQNMINWANTFSPPVVVDAVCVSNYVNPTFDVTTPTSAGSVTLSGSTGSIPAGVYQYYHTWVGGVSGVETSVGAFTGASRRRRIRS